MKPLPIIAMNSTPITVRQIAPSPPRIDVPPTTMPASTVNVSAVPPVITNDAASVAISELIRKNVTITPLAAPTAMPMMTPTTIAATGLTASHQPVRRPDVKC